MRIRTIIFYSISDIDKKLHFETENSISFFIT